MNEFGLIADDLTMLEERLESADLTKYARSLRRAVHRAYLEACKAGRAMRHDEEAVKQAAAAKRAAASQARRAA